MFDGINAYPLSWPMGWKRTDPYRRKQSQFAARSLATARDYVLSELRMLRGRNPIVSTNVMLRQDGLPKSGQKNPIDPGVAVYFVLNNQPRVLACDKWRTVEDNLWAIGKHIEAIRGQDRWGVGTVDQAFAGYDALPAPRTAWWEVLGVPKNASRDEIQAAYRKAAKETHPDAGGSEDAFLKVQAAWEAALKGGEG